MDTQRTNRVTLLARLLIAVLFVLAGIGKIKGFEGTVGYIASKGLPMPEVLAWLTIALEVGGGLALAAGWWGLRDVLRRPVVQTLRQAS